MAVFSFLRGNKKGRECGLSELSRVMPLSPYFGGSVDEGLVAGAADFVPMPAGRELPVVGREAEGAAGTPDW